MICDTMHTYEKSGQLQDRAETRGFPMPPRSDKIVNELSLFPDFWLKDMITDRTDNVRWQQ